MHSSQNTEITDIPGQNMLKKNGYSLLQKKRKNDVQYHEKVTIVSVLLFYWIHCLKWLILGEYKVTFQ